MNGLGWLLAYMVAGFVHSLLVYGEKDSPGMVFLELFCWPLAVGIYMAVWLGQRIVYGVDRLFELLETGDEE